MKRRKERRERGGGKETARRGRYGEGNMGGAGATKMVIIDSENVNHNHLQHKLTFFFFKSEI